MKIIKLFVENFKNGWGAGGHWVKDSWIIGFF
jgi:hypothetical protein